jgi:hypothetical protein
VSNLQDNCLLAANPDQRDLDRDGRGDICDSRFCFVVGGDETNCLDPQTTFQVYSPMTQMVTGEPTRMRLFANRKNTVIQYKWIVLQRPAGSEATVQNPQGAVRVSTPFEYHYNKGNVARFTADEPGEYRVKLVAELVFPDTVNPAFPRQADYVMTVVAEGDSMGGCSMGGGATGLGGAAGFVLLSLLGLALVARRRSN